jgi:cytochrome c oxidase assembly factor CtaG
MNMLLKIILTLIFSAMFVYGCICIQRGRVYCKGRWYERDENPIWYWTTIIIYLLGPPVLLVLAWRSP